MLGCLAKTTTRSDAKTYPGFPCCATACHRKHEVQLSETEVNKDRFAIGLSAPISTELQPPLKSLTHVIHTFIPILTLAGAPRCPIALQKLSPVSPMSTGEHWSDWAGGKTPQSWVLGTSWFRPAKTCSPTGARTTSLLSSTQWGKGRGVQGCVLLWPPALIMLMAFHSPGEVIKDSVTRHGCCWLGNWDTAPGNHTGSLQKMK